MILHDGTCGGEAVEDAKRFVLGLSSYVNHKKI